jgi:putative hydrolase of the HAD superfamily
MKGVAPITTMFLDIGGVLLTDGWDRHARKRAARTFQLDSSDMEAKHRLLFEVYEQGKLSLDDYLGAVIFHQARPFSRAQFRRFMFAQSKPYPRMIQLVTEVRTRRHLKVAVVSNEAREINAYRIHHFKLRPFVDFFVSSCFVHIRKPDPDIFRLALEMAQVEAHEVVYVDDTPMFVEVAARLGIRGIVHTDHQTTSAQLAALGLELKKRTP